jgi:hypothetical protein
MVLRAASNITGFFSKGSKLEDFNPILFSKLAGILTNLSGKCAHLLLNSLAFLTAGQRTAAIRHLLYLPTL